MTQIFKHSQPKFSFFSTKRKEEKKLRSPGKAKKIIPTPHFPHNSSFQVYMAYHPARPNLENRNNKKSSNQEIIFYGTSKTMWALNHAQIYKKGKKNNKWTWNQHALT